MVGALQYSIPATLAHPSIPLAVCPTRMGSRTLYPTFLRGDRGHFLTSSKSLASKEALCGTWCVLSSGACIFTAILVQFHDAPA
jgi:hypothetical protein